MDIDFTATYRAKIILAPATELGECLRAFSHLAPIAESSHFSPRRSERHHHRQFQRRRERGRASDVTTGCLFGVTEGGGMDGGAGSVWSGAASLAVLMASGPRAKYFVFGERRWRRGRAFPSCANLFLSNSHQNSQSPKTKMAANLAASHLIDFIVFLAPQVGLVLFRNFLTY